MSTTTRLKLIPYLMCFAFLLASAAFLFVGHHRHMLTIHVSDSSQKAPSLKKSRFQLVSRHSSFEVLNPYKPSTQSNFTVGVDISKRRHTEIKSAYQCGMGVMRSNQTVDLGEIEESQKFVVNGIPFRLFPNRLEGAGKTWEGKPGAYVVVDVDRLPGNKWR